MGVPTIRIVRSNGSSSAPVCPISRDQAVPGMPGVFRPVVPRALDLPSAIAAANALLQALAPMVNQGPVAHIPSGLGGGGLGQDGPNDDGGGGRKKTRRWEEKRREKVLIKYSHMLDNDTRDPDNWVVMERITYLKWHDKVQKVDFIFEWPYDPADPWEQASTYMGKA